MTATIRIKNSTTPSATPPTLKIGELALNAADGKLFYADVNNKVQVFTPPSNLVSGTLPNHVPTNNMLGAMAYADNATALIAYDYPPDAADNSLWAQIDGTDVTIMWKGSDPNIHVVATVSQSDMSSTIKALRIKTKSGKVFKADQYTLLEMMLTLQALEAGATAAKIKDADNNAVPATADEIKEILSSAFTQKQQILFASTENAND